MQRVRRLAKSGWLLIRTPDNNLHFKIKKCQQMKKCLRKLEVLKKFSGRTKEWRRIMISTAKPSSQDILNQLTRARSK